MNELLQEGSLFFRTRRFPRCQEQQEVDRLWSILEHGIVAPPTGIAGAVSDAPISVELDLPVPYDSVVFLHRYEAPLSDLYLLTERGVLFFFFDSTLPFRTHEEMGDQWPAFSQDEVYVDSVPVSAIQAIAVLPVDVEAILEEVGPTLRQMDIALFDTNELRLPSSRFS